MIDINFLNTPIGRHKIEGVALVSQRLLAILCTDVNAPERFGYGTIFPSLIQGGIAGYGDTDLRGVVEIAVDTAVSQYNAAAGDGEATIASWTLDEITRTLDRVNMTWTITTSDGAESTVTETVNL